MPPQLEQKIAVLSGMFEFISSSERPDNLQTVIREESVFGSGYTTIPSRLQITNAQFRQVHLSDKLLGLEIVVVKGMRKKIPTERRFLWS